jgi:hypothetical protein
MTRVDRYLGRRRDRRILMRRWTVAVLLVTTGCYRMPQYEITTMAKVEEALAAAPEIKIEDRRPKWEKRFYLEGSDATLLKNKISFVPAELVRPGPWEVLSSEVAKQFAQSAPTRPVRIDLVVHSCRTIVDLNAHSSLVQNSPWEIESPLKQSLGDDLRYCAQSPDRYPPSGDSDDLEGEAVGALVVLGAIGTAFTCWYTAETFRDGARRAGHALRVLPGKPGPPKQLEGLDYAKGVTFEIDFDATTTFASGQTMATRVEQSIYIPTAQNSPEQVRHAIAAGMSEAAAKLVRLTFNFPSPEAPPPVVPLQPMRSLPEPVSLGQAYRTESIESEMQRLGKAEVERNARILRGDQVR